MGLVVTTPVPPANGVLSLGSFGVVHKDKILQIKMPAPPPRLSIPLIPRLSTVPTHVTSLDDIMIGREGPCRLFQNNPTTLLRLLLIRLGCIVCHGTRCFGAPDMLIGLSASCMT